MSKPSKAPWSVHRRYSTLPDPELLIRDAYGRVIADVSYSANPLTNWTVSDVEEMRANAKLMAAAPALKEALEELSRTELFLQDHPQKIKAQMQARSLLESLK